MRNASGHQCEVKMGGSEKKVNENTYNISSLKRVQTGATTPNIVAPKMLGVVACVLAVVCKRMQQLSTSLGPAVHRGKNTAHKALVKPSAHEGNIVGQQLPTLLDVTCCIRLHTLLGVVACCCAKFETGQTFQPTTPNISFVAWSPKRSATMLDPFAQLLQRCWGHTRSFQFPTLLAQHCWKLLRPFARSLRRSLRFHVVVVENNGKKIWHVQKHWLHVQSCFFAN